MPKISEVLRIAATKHLRLTAESFDKESFNKARYCCDAIDAAIFSLTRECNWKLEDDIREFLTGMGQGIGLSEFKEFDYDQNIQQEIRYTWLMFAADIAEEEGN